MFSGPQLREKQNPTGGDSMPAKKKAKKAAKKKKH
jgi:hypothetical protein